MRCGFESRCRLLSIQSKIYDYFRTAQNAACSLPKAFQNLGYRVVVLPDSAVAPKQPVTVLPGQDPLLDADLYAFPDVKEIVRQISAYVDGLSSMKRLLEHCNQESAMQDRVQEDLLHRIEFESMKAGNVAHLGSLLHKCRVKRRVYKNLAQMLHELTTLAPDQVPDSYVSQKAIAMASRTYKLRAEEGTI